MKTIVLNPTDKTITPAEIDYADGRLRGFYDAIGCDLIEIVRLGPINGVEQIAVIDEEGMLRDEQSFVRLGELPLAGTVVLLSEVMTLDGADFADTMLSPLDVLALFGGGQFGWLNPREAREYVMRQQQAEAERYRAMGYDVDMTGPYSFIATKGGE